MVESRSATIASIEVSQSGLPRSVADGSNAETFELRARSQAENLLRSAPSANHATESRLGHRLPFFLIGTLLLATGLAKLWMLLTDSFADIRVGIPREILWLSVAFELWLAYENFRIRDRQVLAYVNTIVFASFAIFASIRWLMGYGSCGCSGNLQIPAWTFVLLDLGIVAWFTVNGRGREQVWAGLRELTNWWRGWSMETRGRLVGLAMFGGLVLAIQLPFAAPLRAMALGEPPVQAIVRIEDELILNHVRMIQVELANRSLQPAKIIGMSQSCRCLDLTGFAVSKIIPANGYLSLPLAIKPDKTGPFHQRVVLFLDHPEQFRMNVDVVGSVKGEKR